MEKIIEGNKLIDIFMHPKHTISGYWIHWNDGHGSQSHIETLEYHSSWDWLMPVVLKISDIHYPDYWNGRQPDDVGEWDNCAYLRTFGMRDKEGNYMVRFNANVLHSAPALIEATWNAVIEFIKDYNEVEKSLTQ